MNKDGNAKEKGAVDVYRVQGANHMIYYALRQISGRAPNLTAL